MIEIKSRIYYNVKNREIVDITGESYVREENYVAPIFKYDKNDDYDYIELEFGELDKMMDRTRRYKRGTVNEKGVPVLEYVSDEEMEIENYLASINDPASDAKNVLSQAKEKILQKDNAELLLALAMAQLGRK